MKTSFAGRQNAIIIRTPEGVAFSLPLAGPISRFLAWSVDISCLWVAAIIARMVSILFGIVNPDISSAFSIILFFVLSTAYSMILEWYWQGQTIGKKVLGLRVMDAGGFRLQPSQVVIRNLLRAVDNLPFCYLFGGVAALLTRYSQRLGDLAANTVVVNAAKMDTPRIDLIVESNYFNSLRNYPHLAARLIQKTAPEEADLALQALLRRNDLLPDARLNMFRMLAAHFKSKVAFPEEVLKGISDEQYVRNVADLIFKG